MERKKSGDLLGTSATNWQWGLNSSLLFNKCFGWSILSSPRSRVGTQLWCVFYSRRSPRRLFFLPTSFPSNQSSDASKDKTHHVAPPYQISVSFILSVFVWIGSLTSCRRVVFCLSRLRHRGRGHDPRSLWVAANPETLSHLSGEEENVRRSLNVLMCCLFDRLCFGLSPLFFVCRRVTTLQLPLGGFPGRSVPIDPNFVFNEINPFLKFQNLHFFFLRGSVKSSWNIHLNHDLDPAVFIDSLSNFQLFCFTAYLASFFHDNIFLRKQTTWWQQ